MSAGRTSGAPIVLTSLLFARTPSRAAADGVGTEQNATVQSATKQNGTAQTRPKYTEKPRIKILISKETTRILQPLDGDGYVDYPAAVNRLGGDGVTTENNAAVLLIRACRAVEFKGETRARFFRLLGIQPPPAAGDSFSDFSPPLGAGAGRSRPGGRCPAAGADEPRFAEWLKANERPLAVIVAGTRRDHYYAPFVVAPGEPMIHGLLPIEDASREWGRALALRAMLRLAEGNVAGAKDDLIACHRLGRLIGNSPCLISALVSGYVDGFGFRGDAALMQHGKLTAREALAYQAQLRTLPPLPMMLDKFDRFERFSFLEGIKATIRNSPRQFPIPPGVQMPGPEEAARRASEYWNAVLRAGNAEFDKWSAAVRRPAWERQQAFYDLGEGLKKDASDILGKEMFDQIMADPTQTKLIAESLRKRMLEYAADPSGASKLPGTIFKAKTPDAAGRLMGKVLVCLLLPAINAACAAEDRGNARQTLEQVGLALVAYRADHSVFPARLKALVPKYLAAVPTDPCTGEALRYDWKVNRFRLYSLGPNGADEGGRGYDSQPPGDDILLQGGN